MNVSFSKTALPKSGLITLLQCTGKTGGAFDTLDEQTGGALSRAKKASDFTGKKGQFLEICGPEGFENGRIVLAGTGAAKDFTLQDAENAAAKVAAKYLTSGEKTLCFALDGFEAGDEKSADIAAHVAFGARLRAWGFNKYYTTKDKQDLPSLSRIVVNTPAATGAKTAWTYLSAIADGIFVTRELVSEPPNILYPESFAARCKELESLGVKVEVLTEKQMEKLGMKALLGVGQGSVRESRMVVMKWMGGAKTKKPVCLVGKGVTFDSGGISLKPGQGMWDMKFDMGGAGAVTGAMAALATRKAKANVIGLIGLVENMPDAAAQRPSDVVKSMSGQTIEVQNTDAEGRLVLCDVLNYAQEKYKPQVVIDLATLTGAIIAALAHEFAGLFSNDEKLTASLKEAGEATAEKLWHMPLTPKHHELIKSDIADMKNIGGPYAGSSTAAAFLEKFIKDGTKWAHLDIAGTAWHYSDAPLAPKGASGYGVRLLNEYIRANHE